MHILSRPAEQILMHPLAFFLRTCKGFIAAQGLLLAGAVAYYALLSIVPLLILVVIALSHLIERAELLQTLGHYLEWLVPSQSGAILGELAIFLENRAVLGWVLLVTLLFFSSLAFAVLDKAMAVIFAHRAAIRRRHYLVSALLPYCYMLLICFGLLVITIVASSLQALGQESVYLFGRAWSLHGISGVLLYLLGLGGEVFGLASIYYVMPVGRVPLRHAVVGGIGAALLWEVIRHALVWYFSHLSQASVVYGSLTTAIIVLLTLELAATLLLLGAQMIAEYEKMERETLP